MRDGGHAAVEFALAVAVLLIPVVFLVAGFGPWSERKVFAEVVAAEAARAAAVDLDVDAGTEVLLVSAADHSVPLEQMRVGWCGAAPASLLTRSGYCSLTRGSQVAADVEVWAPLVATPWGPIGGLWIAGRHVESVDLYRSLD